MFPEHLHNLSQLKKRNCYNLFRNRINKEIKQSKKIYYNNYFSKYSSDMKKMWKGIRSIVNIKQKNAPQLTQLNINGKLVNDPVDIAEKVNDFFVNIGPETENCIPKVVN